MTHLTVYIDGTAYLLDLFENESISLTFRFQDAGKLDPQGSFTRSFRIPTSARNVEAFGALWDVNTSSVDFRRKLDAIISVDTVPISMGHVQINKVYTRAGEIHEIELTFYAETPDLAKALGEKKISAITALNTLDVEVNYANVTGAPGDTCWSLIDRGQKWSEDGQAGTRPIFGASRPVYPTDLTPSVRALYLFDNIMSEAGFTWSGWNGSTELEDRMKDYYMPFLNQRYSVFDTDPSEAKFEMRLDTSVFGQSSSFNPNLVETYDNGNNVTADVYSPPFAGTYRFDVWAKFSIDTFDPNITQGTIFFQLYNPTTNQVYALFGGTFSAIVNQVFYTSQEIELTLSDEVQLRVSWEDFDVADIDLLAGDQTPGNGTGWRVNSVSSPISNVDILMYQNAPDYKQIDFVRDVLKMHNAVIIPDRNIPNHLYIEPMTSFIATGDVKDWTGKIDLSKDIEIAPTNDLLSRINHFTYKAGPEYASQQYVNLGRTYGDYKVEGYTVNPTDSPNDFALGDMKVELTLASTPCYAIPGTGVIIPKFINDSGDFVAPGPRLLYNAGEATGVQLYDDVTDTPIATDIPTLNHFSTIYPGLNDDDLNFAPEDTIYPANSQPYNNLFNLYYRRTFNELYSRDARVMTAYFYLTLSDILTFTFADQIFIKDSYWRIIEISGYNVGERDVVQVQMMKIVTPDLDCEFTPVSITIGGEVLFEDSNGDPGSSEQCCTRYGYQWVDGRCRSVSRPGIGSNPQRFEQGLQGVGFGSNSNKLPPTAFGLTSGSDINPDSIYSAFIGQGIRIDAGNPNMVAVGNRLRMIGANPASALFGRNVLANTPGVHVGGGWNEMGIEGRAQAGIIILSGSGDFTTNSTEVEVFIDGVTGRRMNLLDGTSMNCIVSVTCHQITAGAVVNFWTALYMVGIRKDGATSYNTGITSIARQSSSGNMDMIVDTTTATDQHRFRFTIGGGSHPHNDCYITARIDYTQVRSEDVIS